jgi:hypothetical protein
MEGLSETSEFYLRDTNFNLIRDEAEKNNFISNYNNYWFLEPRMRTNKYYNEYHDKAAEKELLNNRDLNKNFECSRFYFGGIRALKASNYTEALTSFDRLMSLYPDARYYSDVLFLKGFCFEKLNDKAQSRSNYNLFVNQSVQKYSKIFSESESDLESYQKELRYSQESNDNSNYLDESVFSNDIPKYYNNVNSPGFNYLPKSPFVLSWLGLGYGTSSGFFIGLSFLSPLARSVTISPSILYSQNSAGGSLRVPIQVIKFADRRFGFEVTPIVSDYYFYKTQLPDETDGNYYDIHHNVFNFGLETSIGYYLLPSVYAGLSLQYMYYNQFNKYLTIDSIKGKQYLFTYWGEASYYLSLRYYFLRELGAEAAVVNNDFLLGFVMNGIYIGYNINKQLLTANFYYFY